MVVKHLFRHLHEAAFLRHNPLVRRFFETALADRPVQMRERATLKAIHELVRQGADRYRDAGLG